MDYKLTFDDGSDVYLAHYGVKGMKWGVHNTETRARYSRGERSNASRKTGIDAYDTRTPDPQVYKAANKGQQLGNTLREKYSHPVGEGARKTDTYTNEDWSKINKKIANEANRFYKDKDAIEGKYQNFVNAAYNSVNHGKDRVQAGEYYVDRVLGNEKRTASLNRADRKLSKASSKQKQISSKYGATSNQNKRAMAKYAKAKSVFEKKYEKLNPERAKFYRELD